MTQEVLCAGRGGFGNAGLTLVNGLYFMEGAVQVPIFPDKQSARLGSAPVNLGNDWPGAGVEPISG